MEIATFLSKEDERNKLFKFMDVNPKWAISQHGMTGEYPVAVAIIKNRRIGLMEVYQLSSDEVKAAAKGLG